MGIEQKIVKIQGQQHGAGLGKMGAFPLEFLPAPTGGGTGIILLKEEVPDLGLSGVAQMV